MKWGYHHLRKHPCLSLQIDLQTQQMWVIEVRTTQQQGAFTTWCLQDVESWAICGLCHTRLGRREGRSDSGTGERHSLGILAHRTWEWSWKLNTLRFEGDYTPLAHHLTFGEPGSLGTNNWWTKVWTSNEMGKKVREATLPKTKWWLEDEMSLFFLLRGDLQFSGS